MTFGVQWLGQTRGVDARALFTERRQRSQPTDIHLTPSQLYGVLPQEEYMNLTGNKVVLNLTGQDNMKHVEPDDFVIHLRSFQGGIEHSSFAGKVSNAYSVLTPRAGNEPRYYKWVLKSDGFIQELQATTDQLRDGQSIKFGQFASIMLPRPDITSQRRIADFLDDQVARTDEIIRLREQQIDTVVDRLRSTREEVFGMGTPVPFKSVVWFREGPGILADDFRAEGVPLLRIANIRSGTFTLEGANFLDPSMVALRWNQFRVEPGDILTSGSASSGLALVAPEQARDCIPYTGLIRMRPKNASLDREYLRHFLLSGQFLQQMDMLKTGVAIQHWGPYHLNQAQIWLTSPEEQVRAIGHLDEAESLAQAAGHEMRSEIALLQDRKRSLITAAVTGEFDITAASGRGVA